MTKPMTRWGIGPIWASVSIIYGALALIITHVFPITQIPDEFYPMFAYVGIVLLGIGIPFFIISIKAVSKAYNAKKLVTNGVYRTCRHPLYGSWIVFIVPGIAFLSHSWLVFSVPVIMYILLRKMVKEEEEYLIELFGEVYLKYRERIPFVCPIGWLKR
ncbi:MAG: isoprenylcysteine carboxylmethyltransferase family protein [Anaerolineales bacterium]